MASRPLKVPDVLEIIWYISAWLGAEALALLVTKANWICALVCIVISGAVGALWAKVITEKKQWRCAGPVLLLVNYIAGIVAPLTQWLAQDSWFQLVMFVVFACAFVILWLINWLQNCRRAPRN